MGIQGLLPLLKSIQKPCSLKQFAGQTLGVDAYGWLHRGTVACALELATDKPTTKYVDFAMGRVRMLKYFGVTPYLVFDGDYLPSKSKTEKERLAKREEARKNGQELLSLGKQSQAYLEFQKAVDVTPEMAGLLIQELRREKVQYLVAPYEADSQMVYLEKKGMIQGILSEDSDLLVFGAQKLLTKLDQYGECVMIHRDDFTACREISLAGWSNREFRQMAIMSGCDYLSSIDKMGLKTAYRLIRKHKTMERVVKALSFDGKFKVPGGYLDAFAQAERTFLYPWVYCPVAGELVHLTPLEDGVSVEDLPFIGAYMEANVATGVSRGELHPHTKLPLIIPVVQNRSWPGTKLKHAAETATPDLKGMKSIDSFFKPRRTPLAELSPNLFTGTPAQQQMARRASASSWVATPVDSPSSHPSGNLRSALMMPRRAISDSAMVRRLNSEGPRKKPRLCNEGSSPVSQQKDTRVESGKSRFFGSTNTPSRPSLGRTTDFTMWSDDSVEEAMSQLPIQSLIQDSAKTRNRLEVFRDDDEGTPAPLYKPTASASAEKRETSKSANSSLDAVSGSSVGSASIGETQPSPSLTFRECTKTELFGLREKYSFCEETVKRLGSKERQLRDSGIGFDTRSSEVSRRQKHAAAGVKTPAKQEHVPIEPPSSPPVLETPAKSCGRSQTVHGGSEDFLVSESDPEASEHGTPETGPCLDFGRFLFAT